MPKGCLRSCHDLLEDLRRFVQSLLLMLVSMAVATLTLLRHGESVSNHRRQFAGWADVELTERGRLQAEHIARVFRTHNLSFDVCFSSCLQRAVDTLRIVVDAMQLAQAPQRMSWELNERHCGDFEGLTVREAVRRHGARRVLLWQCCAGVRPPPMAGDDARAPHGDPRYAAVADGALPRAESLTDAEARVVPYWKRAIEPELRSGRRTLVVAHRNTIRAIVKHLEGLSDFATTWVRVPNGAAILYELDRSRPIERQLLR